MTSKKRCGLAVRAMAALLGVSMICAGAAPAAQVLAEETSKVTSTEELTMFTDIFNDEEETGHGLLDFGMFFSLNNGISIISHDEEDMNTEMVSEEFANVAMTILTGNDYLNVRETASAEAEVVGKLYPKAAAEAVETDGEWTHIKSGSVDGWVKNEYIVVGLDAQKLAEETCVRMAKVLPDGLKVRAAMDLEADVLDTIFQNESYQVVEVLDQWVQVEYEEGKAGYVSAEYVDVAFKLGRAISIEEEQEAIRIQKEKEEAAAKKAAEEAAAKKAAAEAAAKKEAEEAAKNNETKVPTTTQAPTSATVDEAYLLACICRAEASSYDGMLAVANVVLNRVNSGRFPNTISEVIYQRSQFATGARFQKFLANGPGSTAIQAANDALAGSNNVGDYLFFRSASTANTASYSSWTIIGGNCFYKK